jgi:hypothetical protein
VITFVWAVSTAKAPGCLKFGIALATGSKMPDFSGPPQSNNVGSVRYGKRLNIADFGIRDEEK